MLDTGPFWIRLGQRMLPDCCWRGSGAGNRIALTFDDGPDARRTPRLLDILEQHNVRATFFWLGDRLDPSVVDRVATSPHMIGLHGARHSSMFLRSTASVVDELNTLAHTIAARTRRPLDTLRWFRPPWGHLRPDQLRGLRAAGYHVVMASLLPGDWNSGAATVVRRVHRQIHDGALIALHDGRFAGRNCEQIAAQLLPILLDRGYRFVTVDELMAAQS